MAVAGLDIGSRTTKLVVLDGGEVVTRAYRDTSHDPLAVAGELLLGARYDRLVVTGYGRHLVSAHHGGSVVSEIRAAAVGALRLDAACRTIFDVGGQDSKVIALDERGRMSKFVLNDRCAAGTGRFLELMAVALCLGPSAFAAQAMEAPDAEKLSTVCAVFAESEVVSLVGRGKNRGQIARGIHHSAASRVVSLAGGVPVEDRVVFVGGGALNPCLVDMVQTRLGRPVTVAPEPRFVAALGCALIAEGGG